MLVKIASSFAIQRIAAAGLSFYAVLLAARVLPVESYSTILQALFLAKFLQITNLGAVNGYFISRYSKIGPLAEGSTDQDARFVFAMISQFSIIAVGFIFLVILFGSPSYLFGASAFLLLVPIYAFEPVFRNRRWFFVSLIPDLSMAIVLLGLCSFTDGSTDAPKGFVIGLAAILLPIWALLALQLARWRISLFVRPLAISDLLTLLRIGWPVYLGTAFFMLASSADRLLFPTHGSAEEVARYFLGYQLAMGGMMFISALNFTNVVDLGHAHQKSSLPNRGLIVYKLKSASMTALASLALLAIGVWTLENYFLDSDAYAGLLLISLPIALGLSVFYVAGTITPLLAYLRRQMPLTLALGALAAVLWANNALALSLGFGASWLAAATATGFLVYGVGAVIYTLREIGFAQAASEQ